MDKFITINGYLYERVSEKISEEIPKELKNVEILGEEDVDKNEFESITILPKRDCSGNIIEDKYCIKLVTHNRSIIQYNAMEGAYISFCRKEQMYAIFQNLVGNKKEGKLRKIFYVPKGATRNKACYIYR